MLASGYFQNRGRGALVLSYFVLRSFEFHACTSTCVQVQMYVCVLAVVAITLAAIVHDRKTMESRLNEWNSTLELQVS